MLIRFTVENFLSFDSRQEFSMLPSKRRLKPHHKTKPVKGVSTLKGAVIYGANASGKSNLVSAIKFGKSLILNSQIGIPAYQKFRLSKERETSPSRMEFELQHRGKNYAYGVVFDKNTIEEEWLVELSKTSGDKEIFSRSEGDVFQIDPLLLKNKSKGADFLKVMAQATKSDQLFLSAVATNKVKENVTNIEDLINVLDWFRNSLKIIHPEQKYREGLLFEKEDNEQLLKLYKNFLEYFDTGISDICLEEVDANQINLPSGLKDKITSDLHNADSENIRAVIVHNRHDLINITKRGEETVFQKFFTKRIDTTTGEDVIFEMNDESDGTNRIMDFIPVMMDLVKGGNVFIIDEMERSLHANLIYDLVDMFFSLCSDIDSQLIVASHESTLLNNSLLRQDEVWFVHKNPMGASVIDSLEAYSVRFDKEIRKDYLQGRFKAVPRLRDRETLTSTLS